MQDQINEIADKLLDEKARKLYEYLTEEKIEKSSNLQLTNSKLWYTITTWSSQIVNQELEGDIKWAKKN